MRFRIVLAAAVFLGACTSGNVDSTASEAPHDDGSVAAPVGGDESSRGDVAVPAGERWDCERIAPVVSAELGDPIESDALIEQLAADDSFVGGCGLTGSGWTITVEVYDTADRHASAWLLIAPVRDSERREGRIDLGTDEAYRFTFGGLPAVLARNGTTELAIAHSSIGMSSRPLDTGALGRIAAALLREVPKGTGATSWEPSDEEWEAFRDLTGVDGTGRQAPDLPVPPGATTDKWFCSPIEDTPDSAACIQEIDADQVSSYCSQLRSLGVRSNPELAADLEGEIGCEGTFGPWWVIVSRQGATPFWMATAMRAPGLLD